jgi:hypothetical protein
VAALHAVASQVFLLSQHVASSFAMVHTPNLQSSLAAPLFRTWVCGEQALDASHVARVWQQLFLSRELVGSQVLPTQRALDDTN